MNNRDIGKFSIRSSGHNLFDEIIFLKNLFSAWDAFKRGKENKVDVQEFALNLENNTYRLHSELKNDFYRHSNYTSFYINDPKLRAINKAQVRDRVLHHAIMQKIEPSFDKKFIFDSYSSRKDKGTHRAVNRLHQFCWKLSKNNTKTVWVLKCDIKKFFDSVDHEILLNLISKVIDDKRLFNLLEEIVNSLSTGSSGDRKRGIPLGNLTSQLFSNIYMNPFDQYVKRDLKEKNYLRYADDFVIISCNRTHLEGLIPEIKCYLTDNLRLQLHDRKVMINKFNRGIDYLGYVIFPYHKVLRTKTKRRVVRKVKEKKFQFDQQKISEKKLEQSVQSYFGILSHCRGKGVRNEIEEIVKE